MNILQLVPELNVGGVERCVLETAAALVAAGHTSIVISNGGRLVPELTANGSQHITLPIHRKSLSSLWQVSKLRAHILQIKPDIIHVRSRMPAWILKLALRGIAPAARPKVVSTVHGFYSVNAYSRIMTDADLVIAGSQSVVDYIVQHYPTCPPARIKRIFEGIDPQHYPYGFTPNHLWWQALDRDFPELAHHAQHKIWITLPARVTRLKGHETFINIIAQLRAEFDVHGVIIGEAQAKKHAYLGTLEQQVTDLGLQQHISFVGYQADMHNWLAASHIVLSLSTQAETFGRTILEAIALGTPVFAWSRGGAAEILTQAFAVGLVEADDVPAMVSALATQLRTPQIPKPLSTFLLQDMMDQTLAAYAEVLG